MASEKQTEVSVDMAQAIVTATTFDIFNEHNQTKRRELMERFWITDIAFYSPFGVSTGYDALDRVWEGEYHPISLFSSVPLL